jgi:hypothetical protein
MPTEKIDEREGRSWSRRSKIVAGFVGALMVAAAAIAATNWTVGLNSGSSGQGQSASISNLTITATATPAASNLLYPGSAGDVVLTISNPNSFPVTITGVELPTNTTFANGYTDNALSSSIAACAAGTPSGVTWSFATGSSGSSHSLSSPLTVAANGQSNNPLVVTLTNDASMASSSPLACANAYFKMPSFTSVDATGGAATATVSPTTDAWTS